MNIKDFDRDGNVLVYEGDGYHIAIWKHYDYTGRYTGRWMTDISGTNPDVNICATYPRRIDAINGLDTLLRVFE